MEYTSIRDAQGPSEGKDRAVERQHRADSARTIRSRKVKLPFGSQIPNHWLAGNAVATHIANGANLLFPAGERFFVRSVKRYLDRFKDDPEATATIRGFFGQEGNHAREHERFFAIMEEQGYEIRPFLARYERFCFGVFERFSPPSLRLATTAACEHYTAIMAEGALQDGMLDLAHPVMGDLLKWHAAEEIEHKAVAFDVLQRVNRSYLLRIAGLWTATLLLGVWWLLGTRMLLKQDGISRKEARRQVRQLRAMAENRPTMGANAGGIARNVFWKGIRSYLRPSFHPNNHDNYHLAESILSRFDGQRDGQQAEA